MPVPASISDLSTTPSLNSPAGSESPALVDDYLRTHAAFIKQVNDATALKAADADVVKLTGNQTVAGTKTFSSPIAGSITGNAGTVTNGLYTTDLGVSVQAYDADTAKTDVTQTYTAGQRGEVTALTDGASITPNLADSNFFSVTLGGNRTLENPTNIVAGQSGSIFITQDGTGSRTLAYGSYWDFAGGTAPTLSTAANSVDRLDYVVRTSTSIHAVLTKGWA